MQLLNTANEKALLTDEAADLINKLEKNPYKRLTSF